MICYKFKYKGENAPAQMITTACSTTILLGIHNGGDASATFTLFEGETEITTTYTITGYKLFKVVTPDTAETKTYTATISGTVDETAYSHTIVRGYIKTVDGVTTQTINRSRYTKNGNTYTIDLMNLSDYNWGIWPQSGTNLPNITYTLADPITVPITINSQEKSYCFIQL